MVHLIKEQRYTIETLFNAGQSQTKIATVTGKHKSVISRELKKNCDKRPGNYCHDLAQRKCRKRHKEKPGLIRFTQKVRDEEEGLLKEDYSPEQVVGALDKQGETTVSAERIYRHVWEDKKKKGTLYTHLRNQGRRYRKRGNQKDNRGIIKNRTDIDEHPEIVEERARFRDLEVDLIIGKNHKQAIVTINDRASGMLKMRKADPKKAAHVSRAIVDELAEWAPYLNTITADNGKEFAAREFVARQLNTDHYFAKPYRSWERGSNENLNGLVRQYFKKSTDFANITRKQLKEVETKLNNRPENRFGSENPIFVMNNLLSNHNVAFMR